MKTKIALLVPLALFTALSYLLPDLYALGEVSNMYLYFYKGHFVLSSAESFLQDGQLMYYRSFLGNTYISIGSFFIASAVSAILFLVLWIIKKFKKHS